MSSVRVLLYWRPGGVESERLGPTAWMNAEVDVGNKCLLPGV